MAVGFEATPREKGVLGRLGVWNDLLWRYIYFRGYRYALQRRHLTSSLRAIRRGTTRLVAIYDMFQVWSLGYAA
jgi:hypothetical protein